MAKFTEADFYYGSVLSLLLNNHITPALVEGDNDRQVYDITTNKIERRIYMKYRKNKEVRKTVDYNSWNFTLTDTEIKELSNYIENKCKLTLVLICGDEKLYESEVIALDQDDVKTLFDINKTSLTVSRRKSEKAFRISLGGSRESAMTVKCNRFNELFGITKE